MLINTKGILRLCHLDCYLYLLDEQFIVPISFSVLPILSWGWREGSCRMMMAALVGWWRTVVVLGLSVCLWGMIHLSSLFLSHTTQITYKTRCITKNAICKIEWHGKKHVLARNVLWWSLVRISVHCWYNSVKEVISAWIWLRVAVLWAIPRWWTFYILENRDSPKDNGNPIKVGEDISAKFYRRLRGGRKL